MPICKLRLEFRTKILTQRSEFLKQISIVTWEQNVQW